MADENKTMKKLPNNLRLDVDGNLFCADGQNADTYILKSPLSGVRLPCEVVLLTREDFIKLYTHAVFSPHLIQAA